MRQDGGSARGLRRLSPKHHLADPALAARLAKVHHFRTHRGEHEVDLVVEGQNGKVVAIEVKLAETPEEAAVTHLRWFEDKFGDDVLDTTGKEAYRREDGIAVVPAALLTA